MRLEIKFILEPVFLKKSNKKFYTSFDKQSFFENNFVLTCYFDIRSDNLRT